MTTGEFIKMLQEEDPEGNCHLRFPEGIPIMAYKKPGYYDGPYDYINEKGQWVRSTQGSKVDIYFMDYFDFFEGIVDESKISEQTFEDYRHMFTTDLTYIYPEERINAFMQRAEKEFNEYKQTIIEIKNRFKNEK